MNSPSDFIRKISWFEWLPLVLIAIGGFSFATLTSLPRFIPPTEGGWYSGTAFAIGLLQLDLAVFTAGLGILLFAVRPFMMLRFRLVPALCALVSALVGIILWIEPKMTRAVFDHLSNFALSDMCEFFAPTLAVVLGSFGVIVFARVRQLRARRQREKR